MPLILDPFSAYAGRAPRYGADVSLYFPTSARARRAFGGAWFGVGPAFSPYSVAPGTAFRVDFDLITQGKDGDDALLAFLGGELVRRLSPPRGYFTPYVGAGADLAYANVDSDRLGLDISRLTVAGSAFVGTRLGRNAYVEARYRLMPSLSGLNLSGASLTVGLRF